MLWDIIQATASAEWALALRVVTGLDAAWHGQTKALQQKTHDVHLADPRAHQRVTHLEAHEGALNLLTLFPPVKTHQEGLNIVIQDHAWRVILSWTLP